MKEKLQKHLTKNDLSLHALFSFLDKDKSKGINIAELTRGMKDILTDDECLVMFMVIDKDNSNEITPDELITECSKIHCAYVL